MRRFDEVKRAKVAGGRVGAGCILCSLLCGRLRGLPKTRDKVYANKAGGGDN